MRSRSRRGYFSENGSRTIRHTGKVPASVQFIHCVSLPIGTNKKMLCSVPDASTRNPHTLPSAIGHWEQQSLRDLPGYNVVVGIACAVAVVSIDSS